MFLYVSIYTLAIIQMLMNIYYRCLLKKIDPRQYCKLAYDNVQKLLIFRKRRDYHFPHEINCCKALLCLCPWMIRPYYIIFVIKNAFSLLALTCIRTFVNRYFSFLCLFSIDELNAFY